MGSATLQATQEDSAAPPVLGMWDESETDPHREKRLRRIPIRRPC